MMAYAVLTLCFAGLGIALVLAMVAWSLPLRDDGGCDCPACRRAEAERDA